MPTARIHVRCMHIVEEVYMHSFLYPDSGIKGCTSAWRVSSIRTTNPFTPLSQDSFWLDRTIPTTNFALQRIASGLTGQFSPPILPCIPTSKFVPSKFQHPNSCKMADTNLSVMKTSKGRPMLARNGFTYTFHKDGLHKYLWRCTNWQKKCFARMHTTDSYVDPQLIRETGTHTHEPNPMKCEIRKVMNVIKDSAISTTVSPNQLIATHTTALSSASKGMVPLKQNIARTIRNVRSVAAGSLRVPHRREDIDLPQSFTILHNENFLLFDSGPTADRIMVFSTHENLRFLGTCEIWMVDGTFKSSPTLFDQIFIIHGYRNKTSFPLVFCLTPNRTTSTYIKIFQELKALNASLSPKLIMSDFEKASRNALHEEFPNAEAKGCFFHFRQCIFRHIQKDKDVFYKYSNDSDFCLMMKHFVALAFLPPEDVNPLYEKLMEEPFFNTNAALLVEFIHYFERTWIGTTIGRRKVAPMFEVGLWNCFHSVLEDLPKTNNSCEGFHNAFSAILGAAHPTIYKLIDSFKDQQALTELKIQQVIAGTTLPPKKKYVDLAKKLKATVEQYPSEVSDIEYLRRISYCI